MTSACIVVDPDPGRRAGIVRIVTQAGIVDVLERAGPQDLNDLFQISVPLQVAVIAADDNDVPRALVSRLRIDAIGCLVIALDLGDTEDSAARLFAAGAHDVVRMPFRASELEARLAIGMTRQAPDKARMAAAADEMINRLSLTQAEANVLRVLSARQGQIVTRDDLSHKIFGTPWTYGDRRFDVHVTRIRRKLEKELSGVLHLRTIRSVGYKLEFAGPDPA